MSKVSVSLFSLALVKLQEIFENLPDFETKVIRINQLSCSCQIDDSGGYGDGVFDEWVGQIRHLKPFIDLDLDFEQLVYDVFRQIENLYLK